MLHPSIELKDLTLRVKNRLRRIPGVRALARQLRLIRNEAGPRDFLLKMLPTGSVGAEIGVHKGEFSEQILRSVKPRELHLIDPWKYESSEEYSDAWYGGKAQDGQAEMDERYEQVLARFRRHLRSGRVFVHRGSSSGVCDNFSDGSFDWVYIDGNHLYEFVKNDLELYYHKVRSGGYIAGDDYDYKTGGWWESGVKLAVDEFVKNRAVEVVDIRDRQFILRKPGS